MSGWRPLPERGRRLSAAIDLHEERDDRLDAAARLAEGWEKVLADAPEWMEELRHDLTSANWLIRFFQMFSSEDLSARPREMRGARVSEWGGDPADGVVPSQGR